jgi:processive 1,2-diacylglycerol beta-glucosyltransferase
MTLFVPYLLGQKCEFGYQPFCYQSNICCGLDFWYNLTQNAYEYEAAEQPMQQNHEDIPKKRIIVFFSKGGGGHISALHALESALEPLYDLEAVNIFTDIMGPLDSISSWTFNTLTGEDLYNVFLMGRWTLLANAYYVVGSWFLKKQQQCIENLLYDYLLKKKPDLIVSVIPMLNRAVGNVAKDLQIPFLVIPTDLDTTTFINGFDGFYYKNFLYTLSFDDRSIKEKVLPTHVAPEQMRVIGFPLRNDFFSEKNKACLRNEFEVPHDKVVLMILMGAAGSVASYRYVRRIARLDIPVHLIVCLGRNGKMRRKIQKIKLPPDMSMTVVGFTNRISDLMAISDFLLTKAGTVSVCEALHMDLPMILDNTAQALHWEDFNLGFIKRNNFGDILTDHTELEGLLCKYVSDADYRTSLKRNIAAYQKSNFQHNVQEIVADMLEEHVLLIDD